MGAGGVAPARLVALEHGPAGPGRAQLVTFAWIGALGGVLSVFAHLGLAFVGAAALGAAAAFELPVALGLSAVGPAALGIAALADGSSATLVLGGLAASLAGLVLGVGRRQTAERTEQALRVAVERQRAEVEHMRAEIEHERAGVLSERNRLAREVHDVLAHTLGALSVQLEALDAQLDAVPGAPGPCVSPCDERSRSPPTAWWRPAVPSGRYATTRRRS